MTRFTKKMDTEKSHGEVIVRVGAGAGAGAGTGAGVGAGVGGSGVGVGAAGIWRRLRSVRSAAWLLAWGAWGRGRRRARGAADEAGAQARGARLTLTDLVPATPLRPAATHKHIQRESLLCHTIPLVV